MKPSNNPTTRDDGGTRTRAATGETSLLNRETSPMPSRDELAVRMFQAAVTAALRGCEVARANTAERSRGSATTGGLA